MFKRLAFAIVLAVLATGPSGADAVKQAEPISKQFDTLVAGAKKSMMGDPKTALGKARAAVALVEKLPANASQQNALATSLWLESEALTRINHVDQARVALARAIKIASNDGVLNKLDGDLALSVARLADSDGDVGKSLKSYQKAYNIFAKLGIKRGQSMALQGLGLIYEEARDFTREIDYYKQAAATYSSEPSFKLTIANNVGSALQQMGRYAEALQNYKKALAIASSLDSKFLQARILTNIAAVEGKLKRFDEAEQSAKQALKLLGKNDEYGWSPFVWGVKAEIEYQRGNLKAAKADIVRTFQGIDLDTTIAPFRDMHEIAYKIYSATGNYKEALAHLKAFKRLDDEGRSLTASANLALLGARFDFANQKLEIEHLKTEQLQREAKLKESRAATQRILFASFVAIAVLFIGWISWRHRLLHRHRDAIAKANAELTKILGERDNEITRRIETENQLRDAKSSAEEANRAKTHFLANMSHELRTPLNAIIGFSDLVAAGVLPAAKAAEYGGDINKSGRNLLAILNHILDAARLDAGKVTLSEADLFLGEVVENALATLHGVLAGKRVAFVSEPGVCVRGDVARLTQVMEILLSNAAKFTGPEGRIEIRVGRSQDGGTDISVSDDGIGIPADRLSSILEPFSQVESVYARTHGGAGLGLAIANSLIVLHGGMLSIESESDRGTTVLIHLPAARTRPANANIKVSA